MSPTIDIAPTHRRTKAKNTNDPTILTELLCDENFFVRRSALANECTPKDVVELLLRAGASKDLRGTGHRVSRVSMDELERLASLGPFGRELVAAHPNADERLLECVARDGRRAVMATVLKHTNCPTKLLVAACVSMDAEERRLAARHAKTPEELLQLLRCAGADSQLQAVRPPEDPLDRKAIERLVALGACGRVIAAAQPNCPTALLETIAQDGDWRVRLSVVQNRNTTTAALEHLMSIDDDQVRLRLLEHPNVPLRLVVEAARHPHVEVRIAAARHPNAPVAALQTLAADGAHQVRETVARHPQMPHEVINELRRLGSAEDLLNFAEPDPELPAKRIAELVKNGIWPRRLAARHPNTDAPTLQLLACDADHVVREWAARHRNMPPSFLDLLGRVGATRDLLGAAQPDATLESQNLDSVARLGPWAERLVARHPNVPEAMLAKFAESGDAALRVAAASHANTPRSSIHALVRDDVPEVRFAVASRPTLNHEDATQLASDAIAGIRFGLTQNSAVGDDIISMLEADPNADIAAAAKARRAAMSSH